MQGGAFFRISYFNDTEHIYIVINCEKLKKKCWTKFSLESPIDDPSPPLAKKHFIRFLKTKQILERQNELNLTK